MRAKLEIGKSIRDILLRLGCGRRRKRQRTRRVKWMVWEGARCRYSSERQWIYFVCVVCVVWWDFDVSVVGAEDISIGWRWCGVRNRRILICSRGYYPGPTSRQRDEHVPAHHSICLLIFQSLTEKKWPSPIYVLLGRLVRSTIFRIKKFFLMS